MRNSAMVPPTNNNVEVEMFKKNRTSFSDENSLLTKRH